MPNVPNPASATNARSFAELTSAFFGEPLTPAEVMDRIGVEPDPAPPTPPPDGGESERGVAPAPTQPAVGSIGYERYKNSQAFADRLRDMGVERLVDVRELPISRRKGYAKSALRETLEQAGVEYVHMRALGNPKPYRDLYKSGRAEEGRRLYTEYLRSEGHDALASLVTMVKEKPTALMCVEHDPVCCHRSVIIDALRERLGAELRIDELS
jgi:hypothetical protein